MTKQSPSPQHHSPAPLRRPPREIQLSWAKMSVPTRTSARKTKQSRRQYPNIGVASHGCPGLDADDCFFPMASAAPPAADPQLDSAAAHGPLRPARLTSLTKV